MDCQILTQFPELFLPQRAHPQVALLFHLILKICFKYLNPYSVYIANFWLCFRLLNRFDSNNALHKEMLAVLAAVTELIKEQGGNESTTEYFAALVTFHLYY